MEYQRSSGVGSGFGVRKETAPDEETSDEEQSSEEESKTEGSSVEVEIDVAASTVDEVLGYVQEHPEAAAAVLQIELDGKSRVGIVSALTPSD